MLRWLQDNDIYLKPSKCSFEQSEVEYLGVIVAYDTVKMDPVKVKALAEWPTPENPSDVRQFCGFANFYQRFIKDFGKICKPLDALTGKAPWKWGPEEQTTFDELKGKFASAPVIAMWDFNLFTRVEQMPPALQPEVF